MRLRRLTALSAFTNLFLAAALGAANPVERQPFSAASRGAGKTLFEKLSPEETGLVVNNAYDDPRMWGDRYRAYMGGAMGSGVAAGDFDNDGKVDLFVSTKTRPGRLFKNLGGWRFVDVTDKAGLSEKQSVFGWLQNSLSSEKPAIWGQGAVFADVNNDGFLDLFVCRNNAPNLLYINQGDGTFVEEGEKRGLGIVDGSVVGAFADYDNDGWLDVLILTNIVDGTEPTGRRDRLFHNNGKGYFTEVTEKAGIAGYTFGHAATWFDYNGDRAPDLYICDDFSGADFLYRNNRNGTFTNVLDEAVPHTPYSSMGADIGDINNDGQLDLLVADMATTTREKNRRGLAASRDDMLMTSTKQGTAPQYMRNALLLNTGKGVFREAACWAGIEATDWTWSPRFEDFDNDGWQDLHVTNGMVREANNSDVLFSMMRALSDMERIGVMKRSPLLAEANLAFRNRHGEGFEPANASWGLGEVGVSFGSATADFDNDGDLDLVYLNYDGGLSVFRNDTVGQNSLQVRLRGTASNRQGVGTVIRLESGAGTQTRTMTVARGYASGSELVAHFGLGSDQRAKRLTIEWPSGATQVFTNLDAGFAYVITETRTGEAAPASPVLFESQAKKLGLIVVDESRPAIPDKEQAFIPFRTDRAGPGVAVADVDGDGQDDLYLTATTGSPARLLRRVGDTYVEETPPRSATADKVEDGPALLFDVDQNGSPDLLVTKASANSNARSTGYQPVLYSNDGHGHFEPTDWLPPLSINAGAVCAADIDKDGDLDLFVGARSVPGQYPDAPTSVLLRNDGGRFADASSGLPDAGKIGLVKSALFRDVDQDGLPDLVVALEWDYVRYFHNDGNGRFSDWTEKAGFVSGGRGWWNGLACADFNGDGRPDFVAGNLGLNTTYRASQQQPATLYYGDFAQNGTKLIAEAVYDGNTLFPLRARADLGVRLPFVLRKFPKNDVFAKATMADVFGERILTTAKVCRAENFSSGVFLSRADGTYRFEAFPRISQIGPMQGVVAADFDGDGFADVCAVQNTDVAIPRFDGGVGIFLHGRGDGTFEAREPAQSGVLVPGNGRALVLFDPTDNAAPGLFLTRHGGQTDFLANAAADVRWLKVRVHGDRGNPDTIGARVKWSLSNGQTGSQEIGLGGGWLSQSAPNVWIALPRDVRVLEATVVWPDGRVSRHVDAPAQGRWALNQPMAASSETK
ncbi:hypothetical protein DB347_07215 [Opitutaceae bacterium EW11]|nr:hypothetical protein DB347_07215 [Opitutaceae bacterium EW11]